MRKLFPDCVPLRYDGFADHGLPAESLLKRRKITAMTFIISRKRLYFPAITIIAIVVLLLGMIVVSTYQMLNHQKETALAFIHSHGVTLLQALESAASTHLQSPMRQEDAVAQLIHEFGKNRNIANIYLYDQRGVITHDSKIPMKGKQASWRPDFEHPHQVVSRLHQTDDHTQVYELAKPFMPLGHFARSKDALYPSHRSEHVVVLSMSMEEFEAVQRMDVQHAFIMGAILLVLGTAALFFTFVIQNYYLVEKAFGESRDFLRLVVASMPNGMLSIDPRGKITSINEPARRLLGITETDARQRDLKSIIDFDATGISQTLAQGTPVVEEEFLYQRSSDRVPLSISVAPIRHQEKGAPHTGAVIILRDLTEIKQLQEKVRRSEKLAGIGALAATVAHEVRNPLSSIRGFAKFLAHLVKDRPQEREYAELMVDEVDRINNVVTDLLTFAQPVRPELAPTNITEVLEHTVRLVREDADMRDIKIEIAAPPNLEAKHVDGNQITQALLNLLLNAMQAVDAGGTIRVDARKTDSGMVEMSVTDDGPGIDDEAVRKVFEPFYTTREKGSGLGLAIVQTIVENHGGDIHITSPIPGTSGGCRVTIQLPNPL
jgi:two-component system, NtrC family, sensor histidine kinase HydH